MEAFNYYREYADEFFSKTAYLDASPLWKPFLKYLPQGGHILDAGCGSGRDSVEFLKRGFRVTAFDASPELVNKAKTLTGIEVLVMRFEEMVFEREFDGIWTCATLLHVSKAEIREIFPKFIHALKPGGHWYLSFKHGEGEVRKPGRRFNNYTEESLRELIGEFEELEIDQIWLTQDLRPERQGERWTNANVHLKKDRINPVLEGD